MIKFYFVDHTLNQELELQQKVLKVLTSTCILDSVWARKMNNKLWPKWWTDRDDPPSAPDGAKKYFLFWVVLWSDIFALVWETYRVQFARVMYYLWKWEFFKCFCYFQNWSRADKSSGVWHKIEGFSVTQSERFIWYFRQSEMTWQLSHPSLMWVYWSETINLVDDDGFGSRYLLNSDHLTNFNYDKALWASHRMVMIRNVTMIIIR